MDLLRFRQIPEFDYAAIAASEDFYKRLTKTAELSDIRHESSFAVHGNNSGYRMTTPLQEYESGCAAGTDLETGMKHSMPGYGMHIPQRRFPLIKVHFHTTDNNAIPSLDDLNETAHHTNTPVVLDRGIETILGMEIVGLRVHRSMFLLFYQMNGSTNLEDMGNFNLQLTHKIDEVAFKGGRLDTSVKAVYQVAKIMNESGAYNTHIIYARDKAAYLSQIRGIKRFLLSFPVKDIDEE